MSRNLGSLQQFIKMPKKKTEEKEEEAEVSEEKKSEETKEESVEKPVEKPKKISESEFEKKVISLAEKGMTSEKIGESLKREGIHSKDYSKKISQILKEKKMYVIPEIKNTEEKLEKVGKHFGRNKQDKKAMRERDRIYSQLRRIKKYFKVALK